jgi:hypothetical protein
VPFSYTYPLGCALARFHAAQNTCLWISNSDSKQDHAYDSLAEISQRLSVKPLHNLGLMSRVANGRALQELVVTFLTKSMSDVKLRQSGVGMKRIRLLFLLCGLLALVFLVVHPDVDPLDFTADQTASHLKTPSQHQSNTPPGTVVLVSSHALAGLFAFDAPSDRSVDRPSPLPVGAKVTVLRI